MNKNLLRMGYLMVSRALLMDIVEKKTKALNDEDAFLVVLLYVNYKDYTLRYNGKTLTCARGESIISCQKWADMLGWSRGRTRGFFERCIAEGDIEKVPGECPSHIRITRYDAWTGNPEVKKPGAKRADDGAKLFMERYREVTNLPTENKGLINKEWRKLSAQERERALKNIEDYYYSLNNVNFCLRAAGYLERKAFDNDFPD